MALRNIVYDGDPKLRKKCRTVTDFNERLSILLSDMEDTMKSKLGVGLAGPQVGILKKVIVIDKGEGEIVKMVNPEIIATSEETQTGLEGCLSIPGKYGIVTRPMQVTARYQNEKGAFQEIKTEGLAARAICHELDHLNGVIYTDVASRMLTQEELDELEQQKGD